MDPVVISARLAGDREIIRLSCWHQLNLQANRFHRFRIGDRVACWECKQEEGQPCA